jgi:hypothetical protein
MFAAGLAALALIGSAVASKGQARGHSAATGPKANVWVDPNGGSCARRSPSYPYTGDQACASLMDAYEVARSNDTIKVVAGRYGRQVLPAGTKKVKIRSAGRKRPILGTTTVNASNIILSGFRIRRNDDPGPNVATLEANGANDTYNRVDVDTRKMYGRQGISASGDRNVFVNGSTFNVVDEKGALVGGSDVTFVAFDFHDVRVTGSQIHNECVYATAGNLTIRRSHFWNCPTMDLFVTRGTWWNQAPYGGVTIENNVFEHSTMEERGSWHYYGLLFGGQLRDGGAPLRDLKVRYNTFEQPVGLDDGFQATGNSEWVGNIGGGWSCIPGMSFRHNVGQKCSGSDKSVARPSSCGPPACPGLRIATQGWVNPKKHDFRLKLGAPAVNAGDPTDFPRVDKDGNGRPARGKPDAGAYERGGRTR